MRIKSTFGGHRVSCILLRLSSCSSKIDLRFPVSATKDAAISEYVTKRSKYSTGSDQHAYSQHDIFLRFPSNIQLRKRFLYPWVSGQVCLIFFSLSKNRFSIFQRRVRYHEWPMVRGVVYPASNYRLGHVSCVCDSGSSRFSLPNTAKGSLSRGRFLSTIDSDPHVCSGFICINLRPFLTTCSFPFKTM
ncbi:hypothetical protein BDW67DRAFT_144748 [Aspergillus spinulosporus]